MSFLNTYFYYRLVCIKGKWSFYCFTFRTGQSCSISHNGKIWLFFPKTFLKESCKDGQYTGHLFTTQNDQETYSDVEDRCFP